MPGELIPLSAIVLAMGVAFWSMYLDYQKKRLQYQERQLMIERGMTPPALPPEGKRGDPESPDDSLRRGIVMSFLGLGLGIGYVILVNSDGDGPPPWLAGVGGAVVGLIGIANLFYYAIVRRNRIEGTPPSAPEGQ